MLKVKFGRAEHNWLPRKLIADGQEFDFFITSVPNSFLGELVYALESFLNGQMGWALIHEEPATQRFVFDKKENESSLRIEQYSDFSIAYNVANTIPRPSQYQLRLELKGEAIKIVRAFWRGLKELESRTSTDLQPEHWRWGFPTEQLHRLEIKLKKL